LPFALPMSLCLLITGRNFEQSASESKVPAIFYLFLYIFLKHISTDCIVHMCLVAVERGWREIKSVSHPVTSEK